MRPIVALLLTMCAAASPRMETTIRLAIPKNVAAAPVLMLEGLEFTPGERITIEVLGPLDPKTKSRPVLAKSGLVGSDHASSAQKETMDLVVPLNDRAVRLMSNRDEITLTLRVRNGRHPLKFKRAYLTNR